jgi:hypothetical protein
MNQHAIHRDAQLEAATAARAFFSASYLGYSSNGAKRLG